MGLINFFKSFFVKKGGNKEEEKKSSDKKEYLTWSDEYSVGVTEFDNEHKVLIKMLNDLHEAMQVGKGKAVMTTILDDMIKYVGTHFANEEKHMVELNYPDYEEHKKQHREFVKKTLEFQEKFNDGKLGLSVEVMFFLKDWTLSHIKGSDQSYGPFFNSKGMN